MDVYRLSRMVHDHTQYRHGIIFNKIRHYRNGHLSYGKGSMLLFLALFYPWITKGRSAFSFPNLYIALHAIVDAIETHKRGSKIQSIGKPAIAILAEGGRDDNRAVFTISRGITSIVSSLVIHQRNEMVQTSCCRVLKR